MAFQTTISFPSPLVINLMVEEFDDEDLAAVKAAKAAKQELPVINAVGSYSKTVDLSFMPGVENLGAVALAAFQFGVKTRLANGARTVASKDLADSEAAVDGIIEAWHGGEWGAERESSAIAFGEKSILAVAVATAFPERFATPAAAAQYLNASADRLCAAQENGPANFAAADDKLRAKVKKEVEKKAQENAKVAREVLVETKRRDDARHARRMAALGGAQAEGDLDLG